MPDLDVTIIVPCRNEAKHIRPFVRSLLAQELGALTWEVIIADGMSNDGTREILANELAHPRLRVIDNPQKIVSTGLNEAIRMARGEYIVRMDMHTEYAPDYARRSVELLNSTGATNVGGPARTHASGYMPNAIAAAYHSGFACGGARFHNEQFEGWVDTVTYGCWRRDTLLQLGLFDESLVRNQDDELNLRINRSGGRVWQSPEIISWYHPRPNLHALWRQYFQYGFWKIPVIRKHRIPASPRHLIPGAFVGGNLTLFAATIFLWLAGSPLASWAALLWGAVLAVYLAACLGAAFLTARQYGWALLPVLPAVFACYHISYGSGFLIGLFYWPVAQKEPGRVFTETTR
jgi:glycosyltransferase involved in cell wall biosynthesis